MNSFDRLLAWAFVIIGTLELVMVLLLEALMPGAVYTPGHPALVVILAAYVVLIGGVTLYLYTTRSHKGDKPALLM